LSGRDREVQDLILSHEGVSSFFDALSELMEQVMGLYRNTGKNIVHIAVGCTGGRHRSVAVAEWLGSKMPEHSSIRHRDIEKDTVVT
jgi:UPF0042 nucleotide-binding protein